MIKKNQLLEFSDYELKSLLCPFTTIDAWIFEGNEIREAIEGNRLLNPSIDLSNICNLNCPYCYIEKIGSMSKKKKVNELKFDEYKSIIDKFKEAGAKTINIIGAGEPTIDKNFVRIAEYIYKSNMKVLVATNGIEIAKSDYLVNILKEIDASIVLKVNSFNRELQDLLVGQKGYSESRDLALKLLISKGFNFSKPTRLGINTLLMKANIGEVFNIFKFCRENNIAYIAGNYMPTGRTEASVFNGEYLLNDKNSKEYFEPISNLEYTLIRNRIIEYDEENNYPVISPAAYISGLPCIQGLGVQIDNSGRIWHCPTRKQIFNNTLISKEIGSYDKNIDFNYLWKNNSYLNNFRINYSGKCPYKI